MKSLLAVLFGIAAAVATTSSVQGASPTASYLRLCRSARSAINKVELCSRALKEAKDRKSVERLYLRRGNSFMQLGRYAEAVDDFTNLIRLNSGVAGYYDNRQAAYRALGENDKALADANTEVAIAPRQTFVYRSRGLLYEALGRFDAAISDFSHALALEPQNADLTIDRARVEVSAGRPNDAIFDLSKLISTAPSNILAYRQRGFAYLAAGNISGAEADLILYSTLAPGDQEVTQALSRIKSKQPPPSPSTQAKITISGTGFFISPHGYLVTDAHVVNDCSPWSVIGGTALRTTASVVAKDAANDLALLKVDAPSPQFGFLRDGVLLGEKIAAYGYPLAGILATNGNFTLGNVAALAGLGNDARFFQITAPVQPGNSGGPVLDQSGNVVGIVDAKLDSFHIASTYKIIPENVNFAIKASIIRAFLSSADVLPQSESAVAPLESVDLASIARSISVFLECKK